MQSSDEAPSGRIDPETARVSVGETDNFAVLLDIAPLVDGHCLLVSRFHIPAYVHLQGLPALWDEFSAVLVALRGRMKQVYGIEPLVFEHGASWANPGPSCCIDHAHLHLVPAEADVAPRLSETLRVLGHGTYVDLAEHIGEAPYLFLQQSSSHSGTFYDGRGTPSQYLRRTIGEKIGLELWNWHDYIVLNDPDLVLSRVRKARAVLTTGWDLRSSLG